MQVKQTDYNALMYDLLYIEIRWVQFTGKTGNKPESFNQSKFVTIHVDAKHNRYSIFKRISVK